MNFGPLSSTLPCPPPSDGWFIPPAQNRRRNTNNKLVKHYSSSGGGSGVDIAQFLESSPKLRLPSKSAKKKNGQFYRRDSSLENGNNIANSNNCKRPHSTPYSLTRFLNGVASAEDGHGHAQISSHNEWNYGNSANKNGNSAKSRLPDIQMINKYYGLVPKKFTVHSRQGLENDGYNNNRNPRAKSAFLAVNKPKKASLEDPSDDQDYNEATKSTWGKNGKVCLSSSTNQQCLQTRKLSVDRQNKLLKHRGRSSSLPLPTGSEYRHSSPSKDNQNQRVIKIDLNSMSWEEALGHSSSDPEDSGNSGNINNSPRTGQQDLAGESTQSSKPITLSAENDDCNNNKDKGVVEIDYSSHQTLHVQSIFDNEISKHCSEQKNNGQERVETQCSEIADDDKDYFGSKNSILESTSTPALIEEPLFPLDTMGGGGESSRPGVAYSSSSASDQFSSVSSGECEVPEFGQVQLTDETSSSNNRRTRLKKTISFDEQILRDSSESRTALNGGKSEIGMTKPASIRPLTASSSGNNRSTSSPNQNKSQVKKAVLPWTQTKGLSLSERRSKLQKSVSIHSTDSYSQSYTSTSSFDYLNGGGECSDTDISTWTPPPPPLILPGPNSSAYKETRKSLFFHPEEKVATLVASLSPPSESLLEVEVDLEKVALILNNMQSQNKSFMDLTPEGAEVDDKVPLQSKETPDLAVLKQVQAKNVKVLQNSATLPIPSLSTLLAKQLQDEKNDGYTFEDDYYADDRKKCRNNQNHSSKKVDLGSLPGNGVIKENYLPKSSTHASHPLCKNQPQPCGARESTAQAIITGATANNGICTGGGDPISKPSTTKPRLKKAVSISCEKELYDTSAKNNEVNDNGSRDNNGSKTGGSRPRTAISTPQPSKHLIRTSSTPSINTKSVGINNGKNRVSSSPQNNLILQVQRKAADNKSKDQSQCQNSNSHPTNKKLLWKKALMEINQSGASGQVGSLGKNLKCGRPKTAPNQATKTKDQKRQPLKTSTATLVMTGCVDKSGQLKGTKPISDSTMGRKTRVVQFPPTNTPNTTTLTTEASEQRNEEDNGENSASLLGLPTTKRTLHRQSFSLDEGMLLSFSHKEWDHFCPPTKASLNREVSAGRGDELNSWQSSKKREQCLKIYDKMVKTGMTVKLDTILRGMMTPSEYRVFIKAAENSARAEQEKLENDALDNQENGTDAGVTVTSSLSMADNGISTNCNANLLVQM